MTQLRAYAFAIWTYGGALFLGLIVSPLLLASRKANAAFVGWWTGMVVRSFEIIVGVETDVRGEENLPDGPALIASKHQAMWETMFLCSYFPEPAIVLRKGLTKIPIFGWWAKKLDMIVVDREAHATALKNMMKDAHRAGEDGRSIIIFPEGTRVAPGEKTDYKSGVFALYRGMKKPCVPVALTSGTCWPNRGIGYRPGKIIVEFLEPIAPRLDRETFMATLEDRIESACARLLAEQD